MIRGVLFDINGTLTDIFTSEEDANVYRTVSNFLDYQGVKVAADEIKKLYFDINQRQRSDSTEEYPEFDIVALFREIIRRHATDYTETVPQAKLKYLPEITAEVFRAASRFVLSPYEDVKKTLDDLRRHYQLGAVSDGQSAWARAELNSIGLAAYFKPFIVSGDYGYRKPDERLFQKALYAMDLKPEEVVYVGNDMFHDIYGARQMGMRAIFFNSNQGMMNHPETKPDYVITKFSQLPQAVDALQKVVEK